MLAGIWGKGYLNTAGRNTLLEEQLAVAAKIEKCAFQLRSSTSGNLVHRN